MQHRTFARWSLATIVTAIAAMTACSSDSSPTDVVTQQQQQSVSKTGNDSTGGGTQTPTTTPNGPALAVAITPQNVAMAQGSYTTLKAEVVDANGSLLTSKRVTWRSSDANIVVASDTGIVYAKAQGSAKVYATVDGVMDSASVIVGPPATTPPNVPPVDTVQAVASFNLTAIIYGRLPGADTSKTEVVAGASVKLTRISGAHFDTLATPVDAGSGTTDANGQVSFASLTGGLYSFEITPPSGSPYQAIKGGFNPTSGDVHLSFALQRKP